MPEAPGDTPLALDLLRRLRRALGAAGLPELEAWDLRGHGLAPKGPIWPPHLPPAPRGP